MSRIAGLLGPCLVAALAGLVAVGQPTPTPPAKLTPEQVEKLNTRVGLLNEAYKLQAAGKPADARAAFEKVLAVEREVLGDTHPDAVASLGRLTELCLRLDDLPAAREYAKQALAVHTGLHGEAHWKTADARNALTEVDARAKLSKEKRADLEQAARLLVEAQQLTGRREYAKALDPAEKALARYVEILGEKHRYVAATLGWLGNLYNATGAFPKAEQAFRRDIAIRKEVQGEKHPLYAEGLNNLAGVYKAQGQFAKAGPLYRDAVRIVEEHLEQTAAVQSESGQLANTRATRFFLNNLLDLPDTEPASVYAVAFRWRGVVTARQAFARAARAADPAVRDTLGDLRAVSAQLSNLVNSPPKPGPGVDVPKLQSALNEKREALEEQLADRSKDFARYRESRALAVADVQKVLPADAALIDFIAYRGKVAAFVVTRKGVVRVDLAGGADLARLVDDFRGKLSLNRTRPVPGNDESALYQAVWEPLVPHLAGAKLVLVCPDGPLCRLPFAALRGADPDKYLIEEVALAVVPVPRLLPELLADRPAAPPGPPSLLAFGGVDFDADPAAGKRPGEPAALAPTRAGGPQSWAALPGSKAEVEAVEAVFRRAVPKGGFKALTGAGATEAAVRREAGNYRYLHFATHGFFAAPTGRAASDPDGVWLGDRVRAGGLSPGLMCGLVG